MTAASLQHGRLSVARRQDLNLGSGYVNDRPDVSVIIGSFQGAATIGATLHSLARQTLSLRRFEVLVVQNGHPDTTADVVEDVRAAHPGLALRRLEYRAPGLGRARNVGMAMARGAHVTFVDDDDTVSPNYLQALLRCTPPGSVGVAHLADMAGPEGTPNFDNRLAGQLALAGRTVDPGRAISVMTYSVGKLMPAAPARAVGFDPDLRSGEDIPFYLRLFMEYPLTMSFAPLDEHAVYYRTLVEGSLSRQALSYDFNVSQRLDVVERLEGLRAARGWHEVALRERTKSQTRAINRYLRERPGQRARVLQDIRDRGLVSIPLDVMFAGLSVRLDPVAPAAGGRPHAESALSLAG